MRTEGERTVMDTKEKLFFVHNYIHLYLSFQGFRIHVTRLVSFYVLVPSKSG